jgi:hypothetical protein
VITISKVILKHVLILLALRHMEVGHVRVLVVPEGILVITHDHLAVGRDITAGGEDKDACAENQNVFFQRRNLTTTEKKRQKIAAPKNGLYTSETPMR